MRDFDVISYEPRDYFSEGLSILNQCVCDWFDRLCYEINRIFCCLISNEKSVDFIEKLFQYNTASYNKFITAD